MSVLSRFYNTTIKNQMIVMLALLAVTGGVQHGLNIVIPQILLCLFSAVGLDFLIILIKTKKYFFSTSAVISGLIIAMLLEPGAPWYVAVSASTIAIFSKHIVKINGKHIFNPANFGLLIVMFGFKAYLVWWGASINWILIPLGLLIIYRFKRFHLILSYLVSQSVLLGVIFIFMGQAITNALLMVNIFFMFVMLIEPKTSPVTLKGRIIYGSLAGIFSAVFMSIFPSYDPSVLGLAVANLLGLLINKKWK
ncbi:RnfABCDGE type electron transport complex subunit D [bacterium]|nr:RnfABCDGE type electron transport complex subunit D [Candidatus Omnitrophota bacterium]MBU2527922.1 RnfABCDGE type electron transport complex subunit D [bacterium]